MSTNIAPKFYKVSNINSVADSEKVAGAIFFDDATRSIYVYNSEGVSVRYDGSARWEVNNRGTTNQYNIVTKATIGDIFVLNSSELQIVTGKKIIDNNNIQFTTVNNDGYSTWKGDLINFSITKEKDVIYQRELISGENIKTVNGYNILGYGNLEINTHNKGYFSSATELENYYPSATQGDIAYVGSGYPYYIYTWDTDNATWINTNNVGGDSNVDLGKYYTKEETLTIINDYHEVLTQEEYDAILAKENKFYFTYEE